MCAPGPTPRWRGPAGGKTLAMRRRTAGVASADHLVPRLIARAERHDPETVVRVLEPFVLPRRRERILEVLDLRLSSVAVMLDSPYDPHNGAAVIRSCEAFGVQTIHVIERERPFLAATSVARGAEKWVDLERHGDVASAVRASRDFELVGTHPEGELLPEDLAAIPRLMLVLGNERDGISSELALACQRRVRVPMRGFVESLNVSVTAAILLSSATRGRPGDLDAADRLRLYARGLYFTVDRARELLADRCTLQDP